MALNDKGLMEVQSKLMEYEKALSQAKKFTPLVRGWKDKFPEEGGVYVLWDNGVPVYVGETSGLKSRMGDLSRPFPGKVAIILSLCKMPLEKLREAIKNKYKLSYCIIPFGRAEVEEYLILRWRKTLINKPTKRLLAGKQYKWVKPV
jgi:hypothetical protein